MKEILNKYPKSKAMIVDYYIAAFTNVPNLSPEFIEGAKAKGLDDGIIASLLESNPHGLFDFFDSKDILIGIRAIKMDNQHKFWCVIDGIEDLTIYSSRIDAELEGVKKALNILENAQN